MIPIDIGPLTGTAFGSSDELERVKENTLRNRDAFKNFYLNNPLIIQNDTFLGQLHTILTQYTRNKVSLKKALPTIAQMTGMVWRNFRQELQDTPVGRLLVIPEYSDDDKTFTVLYSNARDLNYNFETIIDTITFVKVNVKNLSKSFEHKGAIKPSSHKQITNHFIVPLYEEITNYALYNTITDIDNVAKRPKHNHKFYMYDLNDYVLKNRSRIKAAVNKLDTNPLDVLAGIPTTTPLTWNTIEDNYIDNLLWINLLSYRNIVDNGRKINRDGLYNKFDRSYSLYEPRGRGDKYFSSCSADLLDTLQDIQFI